MQLENQWNGWTGADSYLNPFWLQEQNVVTLCSVFQCWPVAWDVSVVEAVAMTYQKNIVIEERSLFVKSWQYLFIGFSYHRVLENSPDWVRSAWIFLEGCAILAGQVVNRYRISRNLGTYYNWENWKPRYFPHFLYTETFLKYRAVAVIGMDYAIP